MKLIQSLVILLLISFILFVVFQMEDSEGFSLTNIEGMTNHEVPPCPRPADNSVPKCGSTTSDKYLSDFNKMKDDNYILKTKVVSPICPNNPYDNVGVELKKEQEEKERIEKENKEREEKEKSDKERADRERNTRDVSSNFLPNLNIDLSSNQLSLPSLPNLPNAPRMPDVSFNNTPSFFNSNTIMNNNGLLSSPEKKTEPEPAKAEDKKSTPEDLSKCPPCPACERCPEPTVDCKRVVKYKNQSYPVPLIADFSDFSRF
jgi:hypothetical protein